MARSHHFVENGLQLARAAIRPEIRAVVVAEFAERLAAASAVERWRLRLKIAREIDRRLRQLAPSDALY